MNYSDDSKFNAYYEQHCKHLSLKGLRPKTIEAYVRPFVALGLILDLKPFEVKGIRKSKMKRIFRASPLKNHINKAP